MKGRKKLFSFVALLAVSLIIPLVFSFGLVDVPKFSFGGSPESSMAESSSTPTIFADPDMIIKDYMLDPGYQIGDTFQVHLNITGVTDLFAWQINMSWDQSILNVDGIIPGEFLMRDSPAVNSSSAQYPYGLGFVINATDNAEGYTAMGESILGGASGITGNGRMVTIEFLIVGYGWTYLDISVSGGVLPTMLLNSTGDTLAYDRQLVPIFPSDGYFRNVRLGDMTDDSLVGVGPPDGDVDGFDFGVFADAFGTSLGQPKYYHLGDLTDDSLVGVGPPDGDIDGFDFGVFADNFGRPPP